MTLSTRDEQLLQSAAEILDGAESIARASPLVQSRELADMIRQANYLVYLALKPEARLIEDVKNGRKE